MKFYEKLVILRKKNNMSQEHLADKLGVSRQAVSKWESGSSVPDMEKMMQLCKILNCNLEDLIDDGVGASSHTKKTDIKVPWKEYYQEIIDFITKTINMFWSMRFFEKIKCLLELFCLGFLLFFLWKVLGNVVFSSFYPVLSLFPDIVYRIMTTISSFIYQIFGIVACFVILIHIFKIRYLDYFITVEDSDTKTKQVEVPIEEKEQPVKEEPRRFIEKKKNTIVIRDPKHSTYGFFSILAKIVILFIKFLLILFAIPCILSMVIFAFLESCTLWYLKDGIFFLGIFFAGLGCLFINYLVLKVIYDFVLELKIPFQKIFRIFMIGLFFIGFGSSISFCNYLTFDSLESDTHSLSETTIEEIEMSDQLLIAFHEYSDIKFVEENSLSNIKLEVKHPSYFEVNFYTVRQYIYEDSSNNSYYSSLHMELYNKNNFFEEINFLLETIQEKKQIELQDRHNYQVTVYASNENIKKLKQNYTTIYE